jgi:serine/threonine protein kinase
LCDLLQKIFVKDPGERIDIEGIRHHPWVVRNEMGPPVRIPPKATSTDLHTLGSMISNIYFDTKSTIITLSKPVKSDTVPALKLPKRIEKPSLTMARRKSISVTPIITTEKLPTQDRIRSKSAKTTNGQQRSPVEKIIGSLRRLSAVGPVKEDDEEPNIEAIQNWYRIHRPPKSIRTAQLLNSIASSSKLDPSTMFQDLYAALLHIQSQHTNFEFSRHADYYLFTCTLAETVVEMEVCKAIFTTTTHYLQSKRIKGDVNTIKSIESIILSFLHWT